MNFQDKNGHVNWTELEAVLKDMLKMDGYTNYAAQELITDIFSDLDHNNDRIIKKREYVFSASQCKDLSNICIYLGYNINYLSIWPFMCHPWFPTRKASKLTFVCLQLQLFSPCIVFNTWCWKQINVSFEAFLVGNQGWHIKGQMLR